MRAFFAGLMTWLGQRLSWITAALANVWTKAAQVLTTRLGKIMLFMIPGGAVVYAILAGVKWLRENVVSSIMPPELTLHEDTLTILQVIAITLDQVIPLSALMGATLAALALYMTALVTRAIIKLIGLGG